MEKFIGQGVNMAKPNINDGYIDIPHDLAEALMKVNLSGYQYRIIWCIFKKTYGWYKSTDKISLTQFEKMTGLKRRNVYRTIKELEALNMIIVDRNGHINTYKFNSDYDTWKTRYSIKIDTSIKSDTILVSDMIPKLVSNQIHTKENKENIQKKVSYLLELFNNKFNSRYRLTDKLKIQITRRLRSYRLGELEKAIKIMSSMPFYQGKNKRGWKATLKYLFGCDDNIDKMLNELEVMKNLEEAEKREKKWNDIKEKEDDYVYKPIPEKAKRIIARIKKSLGKNKSTVGW